MENREIITDGNINFLTSADYISDTMVEDTESLRLEMLDEASLTRQPDEVNTELPSCSLIQTSMSL